MDIPKPTKFEDIRPAVIVEDARQDLQYLQIELNEDGKYKRIVRQYKDVLEIPEIYNVFKNDELSQYENLDNLVVTTPGGGMMKHDALAKKCVVWMGFANDSEYSMNWGKPDHGIALNIIKQSYDLSDFECEFEE